MQIQITVENVEKNTMTMIDRYLYSKPLPEEEYEVKIKNI